MEVVHKPQNYQPTEEISQNHKLFQQEAVASIIIQFSSKCTRRHM